jgi:O-antigen ligase
VSHDVVATDAGTLGRQEQQRLSRARQAEGGTLRGAAWTLVIAAEFFLLSNPIVFLEFFVFALYPAVALLSVAVFLNAAWTVVPRVSLWVPAFVTYALVTLTWSPVLPASQVSWLFLLCVTFIAVVCGSQASPRVVAHGFALGGVAVSVASLWAARERMWGAYTWNLDGTFSLYGIGTNPNILAYTLCIAACGLLAGRPVTRWGWAPWLSALGVISYTLLSVESSTGRIVAVALIVTVASITGAAWFSRGREDRPSGARRATTRPGGRARRLIVGGGVVLVAGLAFATLIDKLGTLSGRTQLWQVVWEISGDFRLFGAGWGVAWMHPWAPTAQNDIMAKIVEQAGYPAPHGHNSFFDLLPEVGLVGVALVVAVNAHVVRRAWVSFGRSAMDGQGLLVASFLVLITVEQLVFGIAEPMATIPIGWWALVTALQVGTGVRGAVSRLPAAHQEGVVLDPA